MSITYKDPHTPLIRTSSQPYTVGQTTYTSPGPLAPLTDHIVDIQTGGTFSVALYASGRLRTLGHAPVSLPTSDIKAIAVGAAHVITVDRQSKTAIYLPGSTPIPLPAATTVAACGKRTAMILADGSVADFTLPAIKPTVIPLPAKTAIKAIAAGARFTAILTQAGTVHLQGQSPTNEHYEHPTALPVPPTVQIAAGDRSLICLTAAGEVWHMNPRQPLSRVPTLSPPAATAAGTGHTAILLSDGRVQLSTQAQPLPGPYARIAASGQNTFLMRADGTTEAVGFHGYGELGVEPPAYFLQPTALPKAPQAPQAPLIHTPYKATLTDTTLTITGTSRDIQPATIPNVARIAAASPYHMFIIKTDGTTEAVGLNMNGQLGDGTTQSRPHPVPVPDFAGATDIVCGHYHTTAIFPDGTVKACGSNLFGQIGRPTSISEQNPVLAPITLPGKAIKVECGMYHTIITTANNETIGLGNNTTRQLGPWPSQTHVSTKIDEPQPLAEGKYMVTAADGSQQIVHVPNYIAGVEQTSTEISWSNIHATYLLFGRYPNFANPDKKSVFMVKCPPGQTTAKVLAPYIRLAVNPPNSSKLYWHQPTYKATVEFAVPPVHAYIPDAEIISAMSDTAWHIGTQPDHTAPSHFQQADANHPYTAVTIAAPVLDQEIRDIAITSDGQITWTTAEPSYYDIYKSINNEPYTHVTRRYTPSYQDPTQDPRELTAYRIACGRHISRPIWAPPATVNKQPSTDLIVGDGFVAHNSPAPLTAWTVDSLDLYDPDSLENDRPYMVYAMTAPDKVTAYVSPIIPTTTPPKIITTETDHGTVSLTWEPVPHVTTYQVAVEQTAAKLQTTDTQITLSDLPYTTALTIHLQGLHKGKPLTRTTLSGIKALPAAPTNLAAEIVWPTPDQPALRWRCQGRHLTAEVSVATSPPTPATSPHPLPAPTHPTPVRLTVSNSAGSVTRDLILSPPLPGQITINPPTQTTLSWQLSAGSVAEYIVTINGEEYTRTTAQSCEIPPLSPHRKTVFSVTGVNATGASQATYVHLPPLPATPVMKTLSRTTAGEVTVEFEPAHYMEYALQVEALDERTTINLNASPCQTVPLPSTEKVYTIKLMAANEAGTAESEPATVSPPPPAAPVILTAKMKMANAVIEWTPVLYATMYRITVDSTKEYTTHQTEISLAALDPNQNHTIHLSAISAGGETAAEPTVVGPEPPAAPQPYFESPTRIFWEQPMYAKYAIYIDSILHEADIHSPYQLPAFTDKPITISAENVNGSTVSLPATAALPPPTPIRISNIYYEPGMPYPTIEWTASEWPAEYSVILDDVEIAKSVSSPFPIRQITENMNYLVRVRATNIAGSSVTPAAHVAPAAPSKVKITDIKYATNGVLIEWQCDSPVAEVTLNIENTIVPLTENPYLLKTLKQNKTYQAILRAKNVSGKIDSRPYEVLPMVPGGIQLDVSEEKGLQWLPMSDVEAKYTLMVDDEPLMGPLRLKENRSRKVYVLAENKTATVRSNVVTLWPARPGEITVDYQRLYDESVLSWTMKSGQEVVYSIVLPDGETVDNVASPYMLSGIDRGKTNVLFLRAKNVSGVREIDIVIESGEDVSGIVNRVGEVIVEPRNHVNDNRLKWYLTRGEGVFDIEEVESGKRIENVLSGYKMVVAKPTDVRVVARGEYGEIKSDIVKVYPGIPGPIRYVYRDGILEWFTEYGSAYFTLYDEDGNVIEEGVSSPQAVKNISKCSKRVKRVKRIEGKNKEGMCSRYTHISM